MKTRTSAKAVDEKNLKLMEVPRALQGQFGTSTLCRISQGGDRRESSCTASRPRDGSLQRPTCRTSPSCWPRRPREPMLVATIPTRYSERGTADMIGASAPTLRGR